MGRGNPAEMDLAPDIIPVVPLGDMEHRHRARGIEGGKGVVRNPAVRFRQNSSAVGYFMFWLAQTRMPYRGVMVEGICV